MDIHSDSYEFPLTLRVPKTAFILVAPLPATITQRTVEQHFGLPPSKYKQMARDGMFPTKRIGRLVVAPYDDVKRAVTEGAVALKAVSSAIAASVANSKPTGPMSNAAAIAYLAAARTPRERRERKLELREKLNEMESRNARLLEDGTPNPKYDKRLGDIANELLFALASVRLRTPG